MIKFLVFFDESEQLPGLINNVLLMVKLTRNYQQSQQKKYPVSELMDGIKSKISSQIERAYFELIMSCDAHQK